MLMPNDMADAKDTFEQLINREEARLADLRHKFRACHARIAGFETTLNELNGETTPAFKDRVNDEIRKEYQALEQIQNQITDAEGRKAGIEKSQRLYFQPAKDKTRDLKADSELAKVRDHIRKVGKPVPLEEIVIAIGKGGDKKKFQSLRGTLRGYAKAGRVFTNDITNTFGLIEFKKGT
jgi:chromosome segregation ATPase